MTEQYLEELIRKYAGGTASKEEVNQLMEWYHASPVGDVQWPSSNPIEKEDVSTRMLDRLKKQISPKKSRVISIQWMRAAAILVLGISLLTLYYLLRPVSPNYITITNPSGKIQLVILPDSSKVWLNALTTLQYVHAFQNDRNVVLKGEAYFEVTHDAKHPFTINGGGVQTTVLGTSFNIQAYPSASSTIVSVITGKVRVGENSKELAVLTPSLQLRYNRQNRTTKTVSVEPGTVLAWKNGKLEFQDKTFAEIAEVLENWYGVKITFSNPKMLNCRYYMSFYNTVTLEEILSTVSQVSEMKYVVDKNLVTISGEGCQ